jgi:radical SAM superfamily enzyme YgiQ (UPF0313 family)
MNDREKKNESLPGSFERFQYLARRLFAAEKPKPEVERADEEPGRKPKAKRKTKFPESVRRFVMNAEKKEPMRCSFCGKSEHEVTYLLAGPAPLYICGGCVEICNDFINKAKQSSSAQNP